jgi:adenosine deaminase
MEGSAPGLPRCELHLHVEGAIEVATLNRIGAARGLPPLPPDALLIRDWAGGQRSFGLVCDRLRDAEAWRIAILALYDRMEAEGIDYAEASLMPVVHAEAGLPFDELWAGIADALAAGEARGRGMLRLLFAMPRNAGAAAGFETLRCVERAAHPAVVGIDLAGEEREGTIDAFAPVFAAARALGLPTAAHAGEFGGPDRVARTLDLLQPRRIHHGIAAASDAALLRRIAEAGIGLDITPTANRAFGAVSDVAALPLRALHAAGVRISISTDDPALVGTTLPRELDLLRSVFGFDAAAAEEIAGNAARNAFALPPGRGGAAGAA